MISFCSGDEVETGLPGCKDPLVKNKDLHLLLPSPNPHRPDALSGQDLGRKSGTTENNQRYDPQGYWQLGSTCRI